MNYLAHLHLAKLSNTSFTGNLVADFCSAEQLNQAPIEIQKGIALHQFIDKTLDNHPKSIAFRAKQQIGRRRFAGIVQDLLMDYWLVNKWGQFNHQTLEDFYGEFLPDLLMHQERFGEAFQGLVLSLQRENWLMNLGQQKGIEKALMSIVRRWRYGHYLMPFYQALPSLLEQSEVLFDEVYPDVIQAVTQYELTK